MLNDLRTLLVEVPRHALPSPSAGRSATEYASRRHDSGDIANPENPTLILPHPFRFLGLYYKDPLPNTASSRSAGDIRGGQTG